MSPRPHEGPAEGGLSSSLLPIACDEQQVEYLRAVLGTFCHRCRNLLNGINMSLYLFRREARDIEPDRCCEISSSYRQVEQLFDRLQTIYRPVRLAVVSTPLNEWLEHRAARWRPIFEAQGLRLHLDPPENEVTAVLDPEQLGMGLDVTAVWRAEVMPIGSAAHVGWRVRGDSVEIEWRETAPASGAQRERRDFGSIWDDESPRVRGVDALALPLLSRMAAAHGGSLECQEAPGFRFLLRWDPIRRSERSGLA